MGHVSFYHTRKGTKMTESSRLSVTQQFNTTTSMGRLTLNMY
jgi:hypothetical protein